MSNITFRITDDRSFCRAYKRLRMLINRHSKKQTDEIKIGNLIDALMSYVSGLSSSDVVADFNLSRAVENNGLPDLKLYYKSGNLRCSQTLEDLQKQFPLIDVSIKSEISKKPIDVKKSPIRRKAHNRKTCSTIS